METDFQKVPSELTTLKQWVAYTLPRKIPYNVETGVTAKSNDSTTWTSFDNAVYCVTSGSEYDGIGFVFTKEAGYVGIDLDACRDKRSGELAPWAKRIVEELDSYTEVSPSQTGVKIWCKGQSPYDGGKNIKVDAPEVKGCDKVPGIEVYDQGRYFTVTGQRLVGKSEIKSVQPETIRDIVDRVALEKAVAKVPHRSKKQACSHEQDDLVRRARAYIATMPPAIDGQGGSNQTIAVACTLVRFDLDRDNVRLLLDEYNERCVGPWNETELERKVSEAFKLDDGDRSLRDWRPESDPAKIPDRDVESKVAEPATKQKETRKSQSTIIVELAESDDLWLGSDGDTAYATIRSQSITEHHRVRSRAYKRTLSRRFYESQRKTPSGTSIADALTVIEGIALHEGATKPANLRVAQHNGNVYLDLCNDKWECIEITAEDWRVIQDPPVAFIRTKSMSTLPNPTKGSASDLLELLNIGPNEWPLISGWLAGALNPTGPYPIMILTGEQGSAKSTTARVLRSIVDPNEVPLRSQPRTERDLMIQATNGWCPVFDNLSSIGNDMSDALCRISTGGGFSTRTLYDDSEETIFSAMRPMVITGIGDVIRRSDLLDRCLIVELPVIKNGKRRTEKEFWGEFRNIHAGILGGVLNGVSAALRNQNAVQMGELPRMADFAVWAVAASSGLGLGEGEFMRAYERNRENADASAISHDVVAEPLMQLIRQVGAWEGTATELLSELSEKVSDETRRQKSWPKAPHSLSKRLNQLAPNLRRCGLAIEHHSVGRDASKSKTLRIEIETSVN